MRYSPDHKAKARAAILQQAAGTLKEKGFHGVGVDALAAAAHVTSGALYSNFDGKEGLLDQVVAAELGNRFATVPHPDPDERRRRLSDVLRLYLSNEHRTDPASGCVMPALSADVARASDSVRETYRHHMRKLVDTLAPALHGTPEEQDNQAWTMIATIIGAITIARALPPGDDANTVLDSTLHSLLQTMNDRH
ncbi:TetR/AcrR family transcriptional regulator [Amycolatopsis sp. NPDC049253]|uniref:TetR/AcrR family transcriptional regulator n=1 Tax=Amycolatopsis sp. NPDC049253 TaxID=3155274 RepID=UPI00342A562F